MTCCKEIPVRGMYTHCFYQVQQYFHFFLCHSCTVNGRQWAIYTTIHNKPVSPLFMLAKPYRNMAPHKHRTHTYPIPTHSKAHDICIQMLCHISEDIHNNSLWCILFILHVLLVIAQ